MVFGVRLQWRSIRIGSRSDRISSRLVLDRSNVKLKCTSTDTSPAGFQLYVTLTTEEILLDVEKSSNIIWYYLLTYGLSFSIVAVALAIDPAAYTQSDFGVWMEPTGLFYCTFVTPVLIFLLVSVCWMVCWLVLDPAGVFFV